MRRLTVAMVLVMGLVGILSPDGHPVTGRIGAVSSAWAAEDPCEAARRLYNETIPMNEASREKELLEQALALQCRDALVLT
ncbi:MAG: hypothetical protein H5T99_10110, partial [Moorella sp. (in: Bacteria)]|nr:hypothetical protein [Moorella sp. (in: firmicutes)]